MASTAEERRTEEIYDVLGIGFGPANLAIAAAVAERNARGTGKRSMKVGFIESHPEFRWHPGMMISGSRMQISFLKDLATLRDPTSPYTFLSYLASQNRLVTFINRSTFTPTRREFADYLSWVAQRIASHSSGVQVHYGEWVDQVEAVIPKVGGDVDLLRIWSTSNVGGEQRSRLCRNLVMSPGGRPALPPVFQQALVKNHSRILHTSQFLERIDEVFCAILDSALSKGKKPNDKSWGERHRMRSLSPSPADDAPVLGPSDTTDADTSSISSGLSAKSSTALSPVRIAIVGGGQSAAETFLETRSRLSSLFPSLPATTPRPHIDLIIRRGNLHPSDDTPFSNEVFDPSATDFYYNLGEGKVMSELEQKGEEGGPIKAKRQVVLEEASQTNYSVVNPNTIETIYEAMYTQRVEEDIAAASGASLYSISQDPKMSILRHTEIYAVCPSPVVSEGCLTLTLRNVLTGEKSCLEYDAVILGTGYTRQSWRSMLFGGGVDTSEGGMSLQELFRQAQEPVAACTKTQSEHDDDNYSTSLTSSSASVGENSPALHQSCTLDATSPLTGKSTPPTSAASSDASLLPPPKHFSAHSDFTTPADSKRQDSSSFPAKVVEEGRGFKVARNYRLELPSTISYTSSEGEKKGRFWPTVWLQGSNEASHGISDSLLSVVAVRAGEVCAGIDQEGWFGEEALM